jgi:hypothetical protein
MAVTAVTADAAMAVTAVTADAAMIALPVCLGLCA